MWLLQTVTIHSRAELARMHRRWSRVGRGLLVAEFAGQRLRVEGPVRR
jgi:hypothetical protein